MDDHVPLPRPDPEAEFHDDAYVEETGYEYEPTSLGRPSLPLAVRRSLEVLGESGGDVERVWLAALRSDNERTRVEAARVLTQAAVQLSKSKQMSAQLVPRSPTDVEGMSPSECLAALAAMYVSEIDGYRAEHGDEGAIRVFRERHSEIDVPLALLRRALS